MIRVSVLYPNEAGKKFDFDYYQNKHMKLVRERWGSMGLQKIEVDRDRDIGFLGGALERGLAHEILMKSRAF